MEKPTEENIRTRHRNMYALCSAAAEVAAIHFDFGHIGQRSVSYIFVIVFYVPR